MASHCASVRQTRLPLTRLPVISSRLQIFFSAAGLACGCAGAGAASATAANAANAHKRVMYHLLRTACPKNGMGTPAAIGCELVPQRAFNLPVRALFVKSQGGIELINLRCEVAGPPLHQGRAGTVKLCKAKRLWHGSGMTEPRDPTDCTTMTEVRAGVDDVDRQVVALLKHRFRYMDAAARIKPDRSAVRDEWRKSDVLAKVDAAAAELGVDQVLVARLYEDLIESSIAHDLEVFDRSRG